MEDDIEEKEYTKPEKESDDSKNKKDDIKNVPSTIWKYVISVFSFSKDKNINHLDVAEEIKSGIEFKGYNVWVLMCSIVIASIGLNLNSIAVVIGAMLISPLMGPIRGLGLGVGTNNFKLVINSLINFGIATVVSILVSFFYFKLMPFKDQTHEILSRTEPLILDVLVAFFGGLAGIIAASRGDNSTVVPGVAIATALMPPLCVTGYGLAIGKPDYYLGAFYLFILNSLFICLSTIIVVRYLKFPLATYVNKKRERKIKIYISIFLLIVLVPSGIKFLDVFNKSVFTNTAKSFIKEEVKDIKNIIVYDKKLDYDTKTITLFLAGKGVITEGRKNELSSKLSNEEYNLVGAKLVIIQNDEQENNNLTVDDYRLLMKDWEEKIIERDKKIDELKVENNKKTGFNYDLNGIDEKLKFVSEFDKLEKFIASKAFKIGMNGKIDTTLLFVADWNDSTLNQTRTIKLNEWIKIQFKTTNFEVIEKTKND